MKIGAATFVLIFIMFFFYLGYNNFELPIYFPFSKTDKTVGTVVKTKRIYGVKGHHYQRVYYEYNVNDSVYSDFMKVGKRKGPREIGDKMAVEYSVSNPHRNRVAAFYKQSD